MGAAAVSGWGALSWDLDSGRVCLSSVSVPYGPAQTTEFPCWQSSAGSSVRGQKPDDVSSDEHRAGHGWCRKPDVAAHL